MRLGEVERVQRLARSGFGKQNTTQWIRRQNVTCQKERGKQGGAWRAENERKIFKWKRTMGEKGKRHCHNHPGNYRALRKEGKKNGVGGGGQKSASRRKVRRDTRSVKKRERNLPGEAGGK